MRAAQGRSQASSHRIPQGEGLPLTMSCGMCSGRVQRALNKVDGVRAKVSLATKTATIETAGDISVDELCAVVREAGYGAELRAGAPVEEAPAARWWRQQLFGRIASR